MGFVDVGDSLAEVVGGSSAVVDTLKSEDGLVSVLGYFGSRLRQRYLLKLKNLALTHSLTCLPGPAFAIFLLFWAAATASDIWLINNADYNIRNINISAHLRCPLLTDVFPQ